MANMLDLTTPGAVAGLHRVDDTGSIRGLEAHRGEEFLLVRVPAGMDDVQRWAQRWGEELAKRAAERRGELEEQAARLARQLSLDEEKARELVRRAVQGVEEAARIAPSDPAAATRALGEGVRGAREQVPGLATPSSVAGSMRGGLSATTQRVEPEELRTLRQEAQAARALEAKPGKPTWQPGEGGP